MTSTTPEPNRPSDGRVAMSTRTQRAPIEGDASPNLPMAPSAVPAESQSDATRRQLQEARENTQALFQIVDQLERAQTVDDATRATLNVIRQCFG